MSAVRRKPSRPSRAVLSSPYARPAKKSVRNVHLFWLFTKLRSCKSWSLSGILGFLNPLRFRGSRDEESMSLDEPDIESDELEQEQGIYPTLPVQTPSKRKYQVGTMCLEDAPCDSDALPQPPESIASNGHALPGPPPPASKLQNSPKRQDRPSGSSSTIPSVEFTFKASSSPAKNLDTVSNFLAQHANRPIAPEDINQMVTLIQQSKPGASFLEPC